MSNPEQSPPSSQAVDDEGNQRIDLSWLFDPGELEELYASDQPQPGDVLLLNSPGFKGIASRIFQGFGNFSHVGIVVGSDLYIDAVSREGVRIRPIEDISKPESGYALDECIVARNRDVVMNVDNVWTTALEYLERPYKLRSVFMKRNNEIEEEDAVICSKLVAMILHDLGRGLGFQVQQTLPSHFDKISKLSEWRRFPIMQYDLLRDSTVITDERKMYMDYWLKLVPSLHSINTKFRALQRESLSRKK